MKKITIYHGSPEIVSKPQYGKEKDYNDYGRGFYCTEDIELAREWACTEQIGGYVNQYELEIGSLKLLCLDVAPYTILHWLAILMKNRQLRISSPVMARGIEWLVVNFMPPVDDADVIIGYRADDSYFSFARAFVSNEISLAQLSYAMRLGKLGKQIVLKSPKAFEKIEYVSYSPVERHIYFPRRKLRDEEARAAYRAELEREVSTGLFMRDIIREEVKPDDPRLQ
ncbi:MAG: DUF3990 domain-containing protein [Victivallales bacterium]|nr:DUF3990 domain-containing protein [Victivallales bacterium]